MSTTKMSQVTLTRLVASTCGSLLFALGIGCGGSVDSAADPVDSSSDISIVTDAKTDAKTDGSAADTTLSDTGTASDTGSTPDVPGSLFDADLPDIVFEGGTTSGGCYDCTKKKCEPELKECDKDPRCRGFVLCVLAACAGKDVAKDPSCALGCATTYDVGFSDPLISVALNIQNCTTKNCPTECPTAPK